MNKTGDNFTQKKILTNQEYIAIMGHDPNVQQIPNTT
jgi:hypothetical protein